MSLLNEILAQAISAFLYRNFESNLRDYCHSVIFAQNRDIRIPPIFCSLSTDDQISAGLMQLENG